MPYSYQFPYTAREVFVEVEAHGPNQQRATVKLYRQGHSSPETRYGGPGTGIIVTSNSSFGNLSSGDTFEITSETVLNNDYVHSDSDWRYCSRCGLLHFSNQGQCIAGQLHLIGTGGEGYHIVYDAPTSLQSTQRDWKKCTNCGCLVFTLDGGGACINGRTHIYESRNYALVQNNGQYSGQHNWRYCDRCRALYFAEHGGTCYAGGSHHVPSYSGDYYLNEIVWFENTFIGTTEGALDIVQRLSGQQGATTIVRYGRI